MKQKFNLYAPNGKPIVGTSETMLTLRGFNCYGRNPDGSLQIEANDYYKDFPETEEQRRDARGVLLFQDESGIDWPEDYLSLEGETLKPTPERVEGMAEHDLDARELATVLAALRYWARHQAGSVGKSPNPLPEDDIASDGGTLEPMRADEIEKLCERLNTEG